MDTIAKIKKTHLFCNWRHLVKNVSNKKCIFFSIGATSWCCFMNDGVIFGQSRWLVTWPVFFSKIEKYFGLDWNSAQRENFGKNFFFVGEKKFDKFWKEAIFKIISPLANPTKIKNLNIFVSVALKDHFLSFWVAAAKDEIESLEAITIKNFRESFKRNSLGSGWRWFRTKSSQQFSLKRGLTGVYQKQGPQDRETQKLCAGLTWYVMMVF